jgi:tape measure domain-containing protein
MPKNEIEIEVKVSRYQRLFATPITKMQKGLSNLGRGMQRLASLAKTASKGFAIVGAALGTVGAVALKAAGNFEQQRVAFETLLGSTEKATKLLKEIEEFSAATPFQLPDIIEGSKRLLAFGVAAEDVVDTMSRLGDLAQGDTEKLNRLTDAFGKLKAKGKASLEEINRFTEAGVPLVEELAKNYGVTTQEVLKLVTQGKVGFAEVEEAVASLTSEGGKFFELTKKQSQTLNGLISTLKDNFGLLLRDLGENLLPIIKPIVNTLIGALQQLRTQVPKFILEVKKLFITVSTEAKVFSEKVKELIFAPFSIDTYKTILSDSLRAWAEYYDRLFGILKKVFKEGTGGLKEFFNELRESEIEDTRTLEETIYEIRAEGTERVKELEAQYAVDKKTQLTDLANVEIDLQKKAAREKRKIKEKEAKEAAQKKEQQKKDFKEFSTFIIAGVKSRNKAVAAVAKAVALYNIAIDTRAAAIAAYKSFVGLGPLGPALGAAAAGAAIAFGAEQAQAVTNSQPAFEQGGIVPGSSFTGDNVQARVNSGEMILNKEQQARLFDIANGREDGGGGDLTVVMRVNEVDLAEAVVTGYNTGRNLDLVTQLEAE